MLNITFTFSRRVVTWQTVIILFLIITCTYCGNRESYVLVQIYNLGGPAVKNSDLKNILAKLVIIIEHCTWKKLEVDGYIVQEGTVHEWMGILCKKGQYMSRWVYCAQRDSTWVSTIYINICFFYPVPKSNVAPISTNWFCL
jgi:hypothetical protein